jgi:sialidase-1
MDFQVLATRGKAGYRQYRIPAMAVTPSGRVIVIYDARADLDDLPGPVDLVIRTSDDNGDSWSPQRVFLASHGVTGYGDASIIIDPTFGKQGRVIVFCQTSELASFFESSRGSELDDPHIVHVHRSISDDDGVSWTHEVVTRQVKSGDVEGIFASSGMGGFMTAGLHKGRLIHSFVLRREQNLLGALAFSDDHGVTWKLGAEIPGGNESAVACLQDGTILFHSRARPFRMSGRSLDGGESIITIGHDDELPDPSDNGSLCVLKSGAVICTHNHDQELRRRTVAKRSFDGGKTWPEAIVLEEESSGYSTSCELADGRVAVFFERFGYSEMVFCRIDSEDFMPTHVALPDRSDKNEIEFTVVLRYIRPARDEKLLEEIGRTTQNRIPLIDMTQFSASERKEIGPSSGSASGDPVFTKEEFDQILGPVTPGLHRGDELRFSGRIWNHNVGSLNDLCITHPCNTDDIRVESLKAGEKLVFLDLRYVLTQDDIDSENVSLTFQWIGNLEPHGLVTGELTHTFSISTGLSTA